MTRTFDRAFATGVAALALLVPLTLAAIAVLLVIAAWRSLTTFGLSYFTTTVWDPVHFVFGAAAYVYGTVVTTVVAVALATPIAVGAAIYLTEFAPRAVRAPVAFTIELLAYIPSIVYGLWAIFVMVPVMRGLVEPGLQATLGQVPVIGRLFSGTPIGLDLLSGGLILAIMILPILMAVSRVGVARAFGETMAVTMVVGNSSRDISGSLFIPGYTMASAIANQFVEADSELYFSAIVEIAVVLLLVGIVVNGVARVLIRRSIADRPAGAVV